MRLLRFPVEPFYENTIVLLPVDQKDGSIVVDPGGDGRLLLDVLNGNHTFVHAVILTHAHIDHVSALGVLKEAFPDLIVMMQAGDHDLYTHLGIQARLFAQPVPDVPKIGRFLADGDTLEHGEMTIKVIHTPGHSKGSICLFIPGEVDLLLSGDTLFREGIGRTDLLGGSQDDLIHSISQKLMVLDDNTVIVPGHGNDTTIGHERRYNPFLTAQSAK